MTHRKMAEDCWRLIKALAAEDAKLDEIDGLVINLIEMACDSAAKSQRLADGHPPGHDQREHEWEFYANGSFCKRCGAQIGSGVPCR